MKLISIIGARPQFIKVAPLVPVLAQTGLNHQLVHTGQHYDYEMSKIFFDELGLPEPAYHLGVGSGSHGSQTGEILKRTEAVLIQEKPDWVLVYGDTNSTLAGSLAAVKLHLPLIHIEAGLRSFNRRMPEEINRLLTDHISTLLSCPTETAVNNLRAEGFTNIINEGHLIPASFPNGASIPAAPAVANTGDVMYDAYLLCREIAAQHDNALEQFDLIPQEYFLATVHRAENTDDPTLLEHIINAFCILSQHFPVIWPVHPRTKKSLLESGLNDINKQFSRLHLIKPLGYFEMLNLERHARAILTDSGGVQKEAFFARVPCITLRPETEWLETVTGGFNVLAGADTEMIVSLALKPRNLDQHYQPYGNGDAGKKVLACMSVWSGKHAC
ncbi:UDP-N-acetyl glucosamine 2-epimerase [Desulfobacca acetoxidans]|uniref:UDP-N-acetylglucosamine 2-epimerase n=1 Tax=Desulfobacca acetoxidans (strain ATCC 700848 / DSM 11109 / ASRB2) TaxID=880072 RepID=F2NIJ3_DESAR|nr:UDP-N-acetyl glucosamine 2-epimerase [Desulfobacca acetoxidans]AEB10468.1 UDP-N-acetylglucosamine 2-epimerase [Desulfobacca acetoxidans DSM 11109]